MHIPTYVVDFWQQFVRSQLNDPTPRFFEAFHFDDNERSANDLAQLVLAGRKQATAGLVWSFEAASVPLPKAGALSVVTSWDQQLVCVIETQQVEIIAYDEVTEEFAAVEGEGDSSLKFWREAHWEYFGRECERIGKVRELKIPVVCERFKLVFSG